MQQLPCYGDQRTLAFCAFCGGKTGTCDHCPSKVFLDEPYLSKKLLLPIFMKKSFAYCLKIRSPFSIFAPLSTSPKNKPTSTYSIFMQTVWFQHRPHILLVLNSGTLPNKEEAMSYNTKNPNQSVKSDAPIRSFSFSIVMGRSFHFDRYTACYCVSDQGRSSRGSV